MLAESLTAGIVTGYVLSLWYLLREESTRALVGLAILASVALALRLVYTTAYPWGVDPDQPSELAYGALVIEHGEGLLGYGTIGVPILLTALFKSQLIPLLGAGRWASQSYSLAGSVLAVLPAFATARALGFRTFPSLAVAALIATLPWSIYYGRVDFGGELVFHQLLLLAALARLVHGRGGWPEVFIGGLGLCLLQYDYQAGSVMLAMPVVAMVLARRRYRVPCAAVLALALLGWAPHLWVSEVNPFTRPTIGSKWHPDGLLGALPETVPKVARAFVEPVCGDQPTLSLPGGAVHPLLVVVLAALGSWWPPRRGLFLWGGFCVGLLPALLSGGSLPSSHRLLMAYPFIALAAGSALNLLPWSRSRALISCIVAVVAGTQAVNFYFSSQAWRWGAVVKDRQATELIDALPPAPHPPFVLQAAKAHFEPFKHIDPSFEYLYVDNWFPPEHEARIYGFARAVPLRAFYDQLFGPERVRPLPAGAFLVELEAADWSWLRERGWWYRIRCGSGERIATIPTLYAYWLGFADLECEPPSFHTWRGRWNAPAARLAFQFIGRARIETSAGWSGSDAGEHRTIRFSVRPGDWIQIELESPAGSVSAQLSRAARVSMPLPSWDSVIPEAPPGSRANPGSDSQAPEAAE